MQAIVLDIKRASAAHNVCCFPVCSVKENLRTVSPEIRLRIMMECRFYLPKGVRACPEHLELNDIQNSDDAIYEYDKTKIQDMVELLCSKSNTGTKLVKKSVCEEGKLTNSQIKLFFGRLLDCFNY